MGVVVRRYIDFLIILIPNPLVSFFFCSSIPTFFSKSSLEYSLILDVCVRGTGLSRSEYSVTVTGDGSRPGGVLSSNWRTL